ECSGATGAGRLAGGTTPSRVERGPEKSAGDRSGGPMAKSEELKSHIEALRNAIPELKGVLLASNEGLPVAHSLSNGADPSRVAAMAAAASNLGRRITESMSAGNLGEISVTADDGALLVYSAAAKAVLAAVSP